MEDEEDEDEEDAGVMDVWGTRSYLRLFEIAETALRYSERLAKEIAAAGDAIYSPSAGASSAQSTSLAPAAAGSSGAAAAAAGAKGAAKLTNETDKLKLCREEFDTVNTSLSSVRVLTVYWIIFLFVSDQAFRLYIIFH